MKYLLWKQEIMKIPKKTLIIFLIKMDNSLIEDKIEKQEVLDVHQQLTRVNHFLEEKR